LHIATLTDSKAVLEVEMLVEKGIGYRNIDMSDRDEIGEIKVDTDFCPVKNVAFSVVQTRKGQDANYDAVTIDITTDGSVHPKDALLESAKILQDFSGKVMAALGVAKEEIEELAEASKIIEITEEETTNTFRSEMDEWKIEDLPISRRAKSSLSAGGYSILGDLRGISKTDLLNLPGFGTKSLNEVIDLLTQYGFEVTE
jgi:DNA-directed RNA polymerase subunit alpha